MVAMVYTETARPDLTAETQQAVQSSTLKMHLRGKYFRDIQPAILNFGTASYLNVFDTSTLTRYRQMIYMRPSDANAVITTDLLWPCPTDATPSPQLPPLWWGFADSDAGGLIKILDDPADIFDIQGYQKQNIAYQAGTNLYIKTILSLQYMQAAWLTYPDVGTMTYSSWIADLLPYVIVFDAAASVFGSVGQYDIAQQYNSVNPDNPGKVKTWMDLLDRFAIPASQ